MEAAYDLLVAPIVSKLLPFANGSVRKISMRVTRACAVEAVKSKKAASEAGARIMSYPRALPSRCPEMLARSVHSLLFYMPRFGVAARKACRSCFQNLAKPVVKCPRVSSLAGMR